VELRQFCFFGKPRPYRVCIDGTSVAIETFEKKFVLHNVLLRHIPSKFRRLGEEEYSRSSVSRTKFSFFSIPIRFPILRISDTKLQSSRKFCSTGSTSVEALIFTTIDVQITHETVLITNSPLHYLLHGLLNPVPLGRGIHLCLCLISMEQCN
jgi:hypothetical protein